jgi:hypothetical protein
MEYGKLMIEGFALTAINNGLLELPIQRLIVCLFEIP